MTSSPIPLPGSEFNDFLFAPIGEDRNGMLVSVLSGLARSDVDPWQEAARLAELPGETATQRLASLIGALPDRVASYPDSRTIAARLVALLPRPLGSRGVPRRSGSAWAAMNSRPWWIYVVVMGFCAGFTVPDSKPSTAGEAGRREREDGEHCSAGAAAGWCRPVDRRWVLHVRSRSIAPVGDANDLSNWPETASPVL